MVPTFKKDEYVFSGADGGELVLFKRNFDDVLEVLLSTCSAFSDLPRKEKKSLLDFDHPERAVAFLNHCSAPANEAQADSTDVWAGAEPGMVFRDVLKRGGEGPEMVVVPSGTYRMGDETDRHAHEIPAHGVSIHNKFAVSRFEITLDEFDRFTAATGRVQRAGQLSKQMRSPVRGVAWIDAVAYAQWLSKQTGHQYRLPTEAEWEYFARAGTTTAYPWGDAVSTGDVRCEGCNNKKSKSENVGQFPENAFGLYDVIGGAWEWVADCWHPEFSGAPDDGSAWMDAGDCNLRVLRGGSVGSGPNEQRVAFRTASSPIKRGSFTGFRLVRVF
jgi:formylglycine-generating enzyme required for sulfatase activity